MTVRCLLLALATTFLCAATEPPPPTALEPYIKDGHFDAGDYAWMKGRFDQATPADKETYKGIQEWLGACRERALAGTRAALREAGFADVRIDNIITGPLLCQEVGFQPFLAKGTTFAAFSNELSRAGPVAESYLFAVREAEEAIRRAARSCANCSSGARWANRWSALHCLGGRVPRRTLRR
jgi:hypothetical protein